MTKGPPAGRRPRRARRSRGWLSGSKGSKVRKTMPLWQWILVVPLLLLLLAGILIFAYVTLINPKAGAGARTVSVSVLERVEKLTPDGRLDTSASYIAVRVDATRIRLAPRLPDWSRVALGDLVEVEVAGSGASVQVFSWRLPAAPPAAGLPAAPGGTPAPPVRPR